MLTRRCSDVGLEIDATHKLINEYEIIKRKGGKNTGKKGK
jgi:hypothetical protein